MSLTTSSNTHIEQIYQAHHTWLLALLTRRLNCNQQAADLAQDAFVRLIKSPKYFDNLEGARNYLSEMTKGMCIDTWRRQQLEKQYLELLQQHTLHTTISCEQQEIAVDILVKIDRQLRQLKPQVRDTFISVHFENLTYSETAKKIGIAVSSVKNYLAMAMVKIAMLDIHE